MSVNKLTIRIAAAFLALLSVASASTCSPRGSPYAVPLLPVHDSPAATSPPPPPPATNATSSSVGGATSPDPAAVAALCAKCHVTNPEVCQQVVMANPAALGDGVVGILNAHIDATKKKCHDSISRAKMLSLVATFDKMTRENLGDTCVQNFGDAISDLGSLVAAMAGGDAATAQVDASSVLTNVGTCEDQFDDLMFTDDPKPSPMAASNEELENLAENVVDLTALWAKTH